MPSMADKKATTLVFSLKKSLLSAVAASKSEEILSILRQLKTEVVATEELIRETKIGITVNKLRQSPHKPVADLAKEIVRKWKADVGTGGGSTPVAKGAKSTGDTSQKGSTSGSTLPSPSPAPASPTVVKSEPTSKTTTNNPPVASTSTVKVKDASPTPSSPSSPKAATPVLAPSALKRRESSHNGSASNGQIRNHKTDGIEFGEDANDSTGDRTREKCCEMIYDALSLDSDAPSDLILQKARSLELHVHSSNPPPDGTANYRTKMRSLYLNLKAQNNPSLREDVVNGEISVAKLYNMTPAEMASEEQKALNRKLVEENLFKAQGAAPQQAETDAFQCGKCKQRRTMYYQMQTRSADEPMTTFVTCLNCNARWKFS